MGRETCWSDLIWGGEQELKVICAGLPNGSGENEYPINLNHYSTSSGRMSSDEQSFLTFYFVFVFTRDVVLFHINLNSIELISNVVNCLSVSGLN